MGAAMGNERQPAMLCLEGGTAEIVEKKSRFIAAVCPVATEEEAQAFIARIRKENRDARHNCYAYITGEDGKTEKRSDDGEPSGTAGAPMMDLLKKKNLRNVCVVVTRYFGGILLGTGGLVRAYSAAAAAAIDASLFSERFAGVLSAWEVDYGFYGKLQRIAEEEELYTAETEFTDRVRVTLLLPEEKAERVIKRVSELSGGQASPEGLKKIQYCRVGGVTKIL